MKKNSEKMNIIELEDIATLIVSEFIKNNRNVLQEYTQPSTGQTTLKFLKMSFEQRRKLVEKTIVKLIEELEEKRGAVRQGCGCGCDCAEHMEHPCNECDCSL